MTSAQLSYKHIHLVPKRKALLRLRIFDIQFDLSISIFLRIEKCAARVLTLGRQSDPVDKVVQPS